MSDDPTVLHPELADKTYLAWDQQSNRVCWESCGSCSRAVCAHCVRTPTPQFLTAACERNWPSVPWAINKTPDLQCMIDFGVTGIKMDYRTRWWMMTTW